MAPEAEPRDWLILCLDEPGHGGTCLWWGPERSGYTVNLDRAGRYTEAEARLAVRDGRDRAVSLASVETQVRRVVPLEAVKGAIEGIWRNRRG